ncbi:hypothetical protein Btru_045460 [Bulinus truncatus]|nr:hypothetical protein Btru_045460 [Bulinus truncatus]
MPVCQFFLEGRCRYGDNCRNEHPRGVQRNLFGAGDDRWQQRREGPRVTFEDKFNGGGQNDKYKWSSNNQRNPESSGSQTSLDVVSGLPKEIESSENSKMWPFSSMGLEGNTPSIPELYDISCEELRLEAYEAMKAGNIAPYVEKYRQLLVDFGNRKNLLKHMTMETKKKLMTFLDDARKKISQGSGPVVHSVLSPSSLFNQQSSNTDASSGLFGKQNGLFGKSDTASLLSQSNSSSPFGLSNSNSPFRQTNSSGPFGLSNSSGSFGQSNASAPFGQSNPSGPFGQSNPSSSFGQSETGGVFGNSTSGGLFGKPDASSPFGKPDPVSLFGRSDSNAATGQGLFANSAGMGSAFGGSALGSSTPSFSNLGSTVTPFGAPVSSVASSPFAGTSNMTLFGKPVASPFGHQGQQSNSLLNAPAQSTPQNQNIFSSTPTQNSSSIFGGNSAGTSQTVGQFGQPVPSVSTVSKPTLTISTSGLYTPLAELNDQEKEAFAAKSFQLAIFLIFISIKEADPKYPVFICQFNPVPYSLDPQIPLRFES